MTRGALDDLKMWLIFLRKFNGSSFIPEQFWSEDRDINFFTDASSTLGFGGFFQGDWFKGEWPAEAKQKHSIAWLEFFPVVATVAIWGHSLKGKRIIIRSDNAAVVSIINKQSSKCPAIMKLVRFFVLQCLKYNLSFHSRHISGIANNVADALSRHQMGRFWAAAPGSAPVGKQVPPFLWQL